MDEQERDRLEREILQTRKDAADLEVATALYRLETAHKERAMLQISATPPARAHQFESFEQMAQPARHT